MAGKSKRISCDENCKYKEVYQMYEAAYNSAWNEFSRQTGIIMMLSSFEIATGFLYFGTISKCDVGAGLILTIIALALIAFEVYLSAITLSMRMKSKRLLRKYRISLSNIAANKVTEHLYRIQAIEDVKNENDPVARKIRLHCIDDNGNEADICINLNESYWLDENNNNILSTGGVVSKLFFSDDGDKTGVILFFNDDGDKTGVIKYSINDKVVYAKESED